MNHWIRKIWGKLIPSSSEKANLGHLPVKHMPYENAYFFTHVPKTGGTSFIVFLDRFFPAKVIFPHQLWIEIGDFAAIDRAAYHLIRGHFGGCAVDVITEKKMRYLTILRDPVKLAYSTYEYVRRETNTALHQLVIKEKMTFETFLTHPKTQHLINDRMVHNLTFGHDYDPTVRTLKVSQSNFADFRKKMNQGQAALTDEKRMEIAKRFIDNCLWFGILEQFDHSMRLLCYKMAWPPLGQSQKLNINKIKPVISDEARATALAKNKLDTELYEYATTDFNQQLTAMFTDLGASGDDGEKLDQLIDLHYQKNYVKKHGVKLHDHLEYDFSEILLGSQWHRREWNPLSKTYFRWSGPGENSFIDFWILPNHYDITIQVVDAIKPKFLDSIELFINGKPVSFESNGQGKSRVLKLQCERSMINQNGLLRLSFNYQGNGSHKEHFSSDDNRIVGFALDSVKIEKK